MKVRRPSRGQLPAGTDDMTDQLNGQNGANDSAKERAADTASPEFNSHSDDQGPFMLAKGQKLMFG